MSYLTDLPAKPKRLTTRGRATAEAIRDCVPFTTSGAMRGETVLPGRHHYSGALHGYALNLFLTTDDIDYIVWSYNTPIAWHRTNGQWYIPAQHFSITTSKHQGNLYLVPILPGRTS